MRSAPGLAFWCDVTMILCLQKHEITAADDADSRHGDRLGWQTWSSPVTTKPSASQRDAAVSTALHADVSPGLASHDAA